jgi:hypothetical protein
MQLLPLLQIHHMRKTMWVLIEEIGFIPRQSLSL